jgi:4-amino-4-deoxy-L-arabinose transferase-like glycosyltransferase
LTEDRSQNDKGLGWQRILRVEWITLAAVLGAYLVTALTWCVALPLWQGTDEAAHFGLMQYIAETERLPGPEHRYRSDEIVLSGELSDASRLPWDPTQRQTFAPGNVGLREAEIEALDPALRTSFERGAENQVMLVPPLYGAMGAVVYRLFERRDIVERSFAVRVYSIAIGASALVFAYLLARELWPGRAARWLTLALLVAFHPQFVYSAAGGTSDVLAMLWFTVLTYLTVRALCRGMRYRLAIGMGLALGLGLLTKPHLFLTGPALALLFAYLWWANRDQRRQIVACAAIVAGIGLLLWGGWAIRSTMLHGNPFYDTLWAGGWRTVENPQYDYSLGRYLRDHATSLLGGLFASYWAVFGYLDTPVAPVIYRVLQLLILVAIAGLGRAAWRRAVQMVGRSGPWLRRLKETDIAYALLSVLALTPVVYFSYFDYRTWRTMGIGWPLMGRHFAGPLAAQMALWMSGLLAWLPQRGRAAGHLALRAGIVALNYACLFAFVLPRYYR